MPTQKRLKELFDYDPKVGTFTVRPRSVGHKKRGYIYVAVDGRSYVMHRLVWILEYGAIEPGHVIDHINGQKDDNRLDNLRSVTQAENTKNMPLYCRNRYGVPGIYLYERYRRWNASIHVKGRRISLGYFDTFEEAVAARKAAEVAHGYHPNHGRQKNAKIDGR